MQLGKIEMWVLVSTIKGFLRVKRLDAKSIDDAQIQAFEIYKKLYPEEVMGLESFKDIEDGLNPVEVFDVAEVK